LVPGIERQSELEVAFVTADFDMWLKFGINERNRLVGIADVTSGKTNLVCPYCGGGLVAKKGKVKEHHFAHAGETCRIVETKRELPTLPLYDNFHIQLSGKALQFLQQLWRSCGQNNWEIHYSNDLKPLVKAKLLQKNVSLNPPSYEFTQLGQIPVGALPLSEFNQVQEVLWLDKLSDLERKVELAKVIKSLNYAEQVVDLRLYRAQLSRVLSHRLYYLKVKADDATLYKIGVTGRPIEQRIIEVRRDLLAHFQSVEIAVLESWEHRGNVELYFKHRYKKFNYPIGNLTEYYRFEGGDEAAAALDDLQKMQPKVLSSVEVDVVANRSSLLQWAS
jgi:hypothetical protein